MVKISGIKLDKADLKLLGELDKNCRIPSTKLAKKIGKSRQAVDYRINQLQSSGVITSFNAAINPHRMGYKAYKMYLKLKNIPQEKEKLLKYLRNSPRMYWMGVCSGSWDLILSFFAKNDYEFYSIKNDLLSEFNSIIVESEIGVLVDVRQYPKMYFTNQLEQPTMFAGEIVENKIDTLDSSILAAIVNNARISIVELAVKNKSTVAIVQNRLRRLQEIWAIIQFRIGVDLSRLGLELYKTIIQTERYTKEDEKKLFSYVSRLPNVQYFIRNLSQIEIELVVSNYQEYYEIVENLKKEFPDVIKTVDTVLMITDEWTPGFRNLLKEKA
ncbi:MAG: AsnC family transcriptional regulator [Candidatus Pacearchaeota archaeon]|nr:AsnC family transcriptional regulator [Candidatus Pacearchaeota archaeon]